jgi:hypothetical protein
MLNKKSGFTLIEMIVTVAIASILMLMATDVIMKNIIDVNNNNNNSIDIQVGVTNTLDSIKNTLKSSIKVHIVGKDIFKENMTKSDLENLDNRYNYIGFYNDDSGNKILANIMYTDNSAGDKFTVVPIISLGKNDSLSPVKTTYTMEFFKNDSKYEEKLKKGILNLTVKGVSQSIDSNGNVKTNEKPKEFELTTDILLPNANKIYLKGKIKDATAIAYDNFQIGQGKLTYNDLSIVLVVDLSNSMKFSLGEKYQTQPNPIFKIQGKDEYVIVYAGGLWMFNPGHKFDINDSRHYKEIAKYYSESELKESEYSPRKYLSKVALDIFIDDLNRLGNAKGSVIDMYMFYFHEWLQHDKASDVSNGKYIYLKKDLSEYGPYILDGRSDSTNKVKSDLIKKLKLGFIVEDYQEISEEKTLETLIPENGKTRIEKFQGREIIAYPRGRYGGTNTGKAFLQALELLNQLYDEDSNKKKILIFVTDGEPSFTYVGNENIDIVNYDKYKSISDKSRLKNKSYTVGHDATINYIKDVLDPKNKNNLPTTFDKAYIIGFSGVEFDKQKLKIIGNALSNGHKDNVTIMDTSNLVELKKALRDITDDIENSITK